MDYWTIGTCAATRPGARAAWPAGARGSVACGGGGDNGQEGQGAGPLHPDAVSPRTARHHSIGVNPIVCYDEHMCVATANNSLYVYESMCQIVVDTCVPQV